MSMRLFFKLATLGFALAIAFFSLQPAGDYSGPVHADKVQHFLAYGALTAFAAMGWPRQKLILIVLVATIFGIGVEIAQGLGGQGRTPSVLDAIANGTGAGIAALITAYIRKLLAMRSA